MLNEVGIAKTVALLTFEYQTTLVKNELRCIIAKCKKTEMNFLRQCA